MAEEQDNALERMRHSTSHVMAQAVQSMFPEAKFGIGPAIENGFYYDFDLPRSLTPDDLVRIEEEMCKIVAADLPFEHRTMPRDEAIGYFEERGQDYKVELIQDLPDAEMSIYGQDGFVDLCRGPHLERTGQIGPFKLLSLAGAYWRGDETRPMLQRIYGTVFPTQEDLDRHLWRLAEAERRDHRRLGRELDLFHISDDVGPGLVLWHPKGGTVRQLVEDFWRAEHRKRGYEIVYTPHIARAVLWDISGHLGWYRENMYAPMKIDTQEYLIKPMNCPFHIEIYKWQTRSYRDLPLRWAELGTVYRYERAGVLHGLLRVRGFTQDDAHIFCRPDQLEDELVRVVEMAKFMLGSFGYTEYEIDLSVADPNNMAKYIGTPEVWAQAEGALRTALERLNLSYTRQEGEAAFYGPKIDIKMKDALGRAWQGPTIQVDFNLAERFDLAYVAQDGTAQRPVMVHRVVLGSIERFIGGLVEHYAGAFPVWLAPVQALVIPIADRHAEYARTVQETLRAEGFRAGIDVRRERMQHKIREAQVQQVPYMLVVGDREAAEGTVSVRLRTEQDLGPQPLAGFVTLLKEKVASKSLEV